MQYNFYGTDLYVSVRKASGEFFLSCCYEKFVKYYFWYCKREYLLRKAYQNVIKLSPDMYYLLDKITSRGHAENVPKRDKEFCIWS